MAQPSSSPEWPGPDWREVQPFPFAGARRAFTGGGSERIIPVTYYRRPSDKRLVALTGFTERVEGAPGQAHGGAILAVLDEALGAAAWIEGYPVFTVRLNAEFRKSVPIPSELLVETEILRVRHRLVSVRGGLVGPDGTCYAKSDAEYFLLDDATTKRLSA